MENIKRFLTQRGEVILDKNKHTCVNKTSLSGLDYESLLFSHGTLCCCMKTTMRHTYAAYYNNMVKMSSLTGVDQKWPNNNTIKT